MNASLPLTPRERQIVALAAEGSTDKETCAALGMSIFTIRTHWDRIKAKKDGAPRMRIVAQFAAERAVAEVLTGGAA